MFDEAYPVRNLTGATYNPRQIDDVALAELCESIEVLGMVKPVIITVGGTIVAGHQRTKALQKIGKNTSPVFVLGKITTHDEVMFNQLHNGTDLDTGRENCRVAPAAEEVEGYAYAPTESVSADFRAPGAGVRSEITKLLGRYGNWGGCVADFAGRVISGSTYAMACRAIGMPVRVYYVPPTKAKMVADYFGRAYGEFSYEHLPKIPSLQTFAQPFRLRNSKTPNKSRSYEEWVIPNLGPQQRHLDFGCGQGDYIRYLQQNKYNSWGIEFFFRRGNAINKSAVRRMIDKAIEAIREGGLFDHVIMDFVLNSVVDVQAAHDVLTCVSAFCKPGGTVYVSGRMDTMGEMGTKSRGAGAIQVLFLDDYGFSGQIHRGGWFYQLHNTKPQVKEIMARYYNPTNKIRFAGTKWMAMATKAVYLSEEVCAGAIRREFDLPWVGGELVGRADAMLEVWRPAFHEAHAGLEMQEWEGLPYIKPKLEQDDGT